MERNKLTFIFMLISVVFLQSVSAAVTLQISPPSKSLSLNHGESESITFTIDNDQNLCPLSCDWELKDLTSNNVLNSGNKKADPSTPFSLTLDFTAPKKAPNKALGTVDYLLDFKCNEIESLICWWGDYATKQSSITLSYDLSDTDKKAKENAKNKLDDLNSNLKTIEEKDVNVKSKISNQPSNLLVSDINNQIQDYYSSYQNYKSKYNSAKNDWENLEFQNALNTLNTLSSAFGSELISKYDTLKSDLDERIELHNIAVEKFNQLSNKITELNNIGKITKSSDITNTLNNFESLKNNFESGNFNDYSTLTQEINILTNEAESVKSKVENNLGSAIKEGVNLVKSESGKAGSKITGFETITNLEYSIESLTQVCNQLTSIRDEVVKENNEKVNSYHGQVKEINNYNYKVEDTNSKVNELNQISDRVHTLVNKEGIDSLDYSECQNNLNQLKDELQNQNTKDLDYTSCSQLIQELEEIESTRDKSFFLNIKLFFRKLFHIGYVSFPKVETLEVKDIPKEPELKEVSDKTKTYLVDKCDIKIEDSDVLKLQKANSQDYDIDYSSEIGNAQEKENICCVFGKCEPCCEDNACLTDESSYPTVFLHGHAFKSWNSPEYSLDAFNGMQNKLLSEGFRSGGMILPNIPKTNYVRGEWGKVKVPITAKTTYYYNVYDSEGRLFSEPSKQESIDEYSKRLGDVIEAVKYRSNRNKVNIVAHSMGGLVARNYIKKYGGDSSVNKLIMVGTPNHGIYGQVDSFCSVTGASTECGQMKADSNFIESLNSGDETPGNVKYYTIAGSGCVLSSIDGDGISRVESVKLNGAKNVKVNGKCEGFFSRDFHSNLLNPSLYGETTDYVATFLKE